MSNIIEVTYIYECVGTTELDLNEFNGDLDAALNSLRNQEEIPWGEYLEDSFVIESWAPIDEPENRVVGDTEKLNDKYGG